MSGQPEVWTGGVADQALLAATLAKAFHGGELAGWLVPDPDERAAIYPTYFGLLLDGFLAQPNVRIEVYDAFHGVAIWAAVQTRFSLPIPGYERRLAACCDPHTPRFAAMDAAMDAHHPLGQHEYLVHLAVAPKRQGRGIGSRLLQHRLARLDPAGRVAYLEATGPRTVALYRQHGFQLLDPVPLGDDVALYPMHRPPNNPIQDR
ncbi:GNAT family N-acetyltransferase [Dactylosporangium sp. McL0621]|uniref:GNAT family N-acetyltransferase n=1 Tax=Dactylosporangium sp. McL0621 TaxID=3415678 RepID=UPI003CEDFB66